MKTKNNFSKELPILIVVLLPVLFFALPIDSLQGETEINWVHPSQISILATLAIFIGLNIFIYGILLLAQRIDPKRKNFEAFKSSIYKIRFTISLFMTIVTGIFVSSNFGIEINELKTIKILVFALFAVIGNYTYSVKPNYVIGIRTYWTLNNETVWRKTHQLGSKIMVGFSLTGLVISFIPQNEVVGLIVFFGIIMIMVLIPVVYSYRLYKKLATK